jgi:hypothetical protein
MKRVTIQLALVSVFLLALGVVGRFGSHVSALQQDSAADSAGYMLSWWTVDGGGVTFAKSDGYALGGTVGQPDASVWRGEGYTLAGGFWGGAMGEYRIYLPLVLRNT